MYKRASDSAQQRLLGRGPLKAAGAGPTYRMTGPEPSKVRKRKIKRLLAMEAARKKKKEETLRRQELQMEKRREQERERKQQRIEKLSKRIREGLRGGIRPRAG
jgi:anti-sigma28 factor (negative regulator of flagellin synthesis)